VCERAKDGHGFGEALPLNVIEELVGSHGRLLESGPHGFECGQGLRLVDAELMKV
jgi:hypothetical protein